jgi:1-deoxy-D-xylulose-5-phosphate reductoisomerase
MRSVTILGSTGSIGQNTIDLLQRNPDAFRVEALTASRNSTLLAQQARSLGARYVAIADPDHYPVLREALAGTGIETGCGPQALIEAAQRPAEWVMAGIVGAAGLAPTLAASTTQSGNASTATAPIRSTVSS